MIYIIPIYKTFITILAVVLAIFSIIKDWKFYKRSTIVNRIINKYLICGWIVFGILSTISIWLNPAIEKKINSNIIKSFKPNFKIEFYEVSDSTLRIEIQTKENKTSIDRLCLNFDIPGVYKSNKVRFKERIENIDIEHSFRNGIGEDTLSEELNIWINNISQSSFLSFLIRYSPTKPRPVPGSENTQYEWIFMPVMDLHDYCKCEYTWHYNDNDLVEKEYISLTKLKYIQNDNDNFLYFWQGKFINRFDPDAKVPFENIYTKEWLDSLEESRKEW